MLEQPGLVSRSSSYVTRGPRASTRDRSPTCSSSLSRSGRADHRAPTCRLRGRLGRACRARVCRAHRPLPAAACAACPRRSRGFPLGARCLARLAMRSTTSWRTRAHDEHRRRRRARERLRPDDKPRARLGRLAPRPRPPSEQHARRGRPRPRALRPRARMASMMAPTLAFDDAGLELGARGGGRHAPAHRARRRGRGRPWRWTDEVQRAIDRPRFHPVDGAVNASQRAQRDVLEVRNRRGDHEERTGHVGGRVYCRLGICVGGPSSSGETRTRAPKR